MRRLLLLVLLGCSSQTVAGDACPTRDEMLCGLTAGGSGVALICEPTGSKLEWTYLLDCKSCNDVRDDKSELQCDGVNRASEGAHCEIPSAGACAAANPAHVLECDSNTWTSVIDCSTAGKSCGTVAGGKLGCV